MYISIPVSHRLRRFLGVACVTLLAACGGGEVTDEPGSPTGQPGGSNSSSSSSSSSGDPIAVPMTGSDYYYQELQGSASCASCHGDMGEGVANRGGPILACGHNCESPTALENKISASMPIGNTGACRGECASKLADFIWTDLMGNAPVTAACDNPVSKSSPMRRLNRRELANVVNDVFGTGGELMIAGMPRETEVFSGFPTVGSALTTSRDWTDSLTNAAVAVADALVDGGHFKADCSLSNFIPDPVAAPPAGDQCNTTQECQGIYGSAANDCFDSESNSSVCMCGSQRCDAQWVSCANEDQTCSFPGTKEVRYGANGTYSTGTFTGSVQCSNAVFGDPIPNTVKRCEYRATDQGSTAGQCFEADIKYAGELLFRRPLTSAEVTRLKSLRDNARSTQDGLKTAIVSLLTSPKFLFSIPSDKKDTARSLTGMELADRLALTLWGSIPDKLLMQAANGGFTDAELEQQIDRMIDSPKFARFSDVFVEPWIGLSNYSQKGADVGMSDAEWNALLNDMRTETYTFVRYIIENNLPINELYTANYSFLNTRLASHYGVPSPSLGPNNFVRTEFPSDSVRRGLLMHASVLSKGFDGTKTSVVKRGVIPLEAFTCTAPEPPNDPDIANAVNEQNASATTEKAKILARAEPGKTCAGCHATIDPIGWVFTQFGIAGEEVFEDPDGDPLSTAGVLYNQNFSSAYDMVDVLVGEDAFGSCFSTKFLIHSIGRRVSYNNTEDKCEIDKALSVADMDGTVGARDLVKALLMGDISTFSGTIAE